MYSSFPGHFISFEGIDGCGKTTQMQLLAQRFAESGISHLVTREPGGTAIGAQIRQIVLRADNRGLAIPTELLLYAADRAQHVQTQLLPALQAGQVVLCDRYADSTVAYQGYGRQLPQMLIARINRIATAGLRPALTLFFDLNIAIAQQRKMAQQRLLSEAHSLDRLEAEDLEFHQRVQQGYYKLVQRDPQRFVTISVLDADAPETIFAQVLATVQARFPMLKI
jgi:dTMP kinase